MLTRTNSEALGGALTAMRNRRLHDFTRGVAITSSIHPGEHTHVELVRYGKGSNAMGLLSTLMTDGADRCRAASHGFGRRPVIRASSRRCMPA